MNDLPLNGRDFTQLLVLTPGISPVNNGQGGPSGGQYATPEPINQTSTIPSVNGQGNRSNYFFTDGLSNFGAFHSVYAVPPIIDEIQEFKVVSHTDSAEYGSVTGGVVNVVTKSGTNRLSRLSVRVFPQCSLGCLRPTSCHPVRPGRLLTRTNSAELSEVRFGSGNCTTAGTRPSSSGHTRDSVFRRPAILRRKFQLLRSSPEMRASWPTQIYNPFSTVPDPANPGQYIRQPYPGNQIPSDPHQHMQAYAKFVFPAAGPAFDANGDNVLDTTPETQTINQWTARIDQKIGKNDSAWFRYSYDTSVVSDSGGVPGIPNVNTQSEQELWRQLRPCLQSQSRSSG